MLAKMSRTECSTDESMPRSQRIKGLPLKCGLQPSDEQKYSVVELVKQKGGVLFVHWCGASAVLGYLLIHISALSNNFVKDPHTIVKTGQVVKVKVLEVDEKRKRIALTMRLADAAPQSNGKPEQRNTQRQQDSLNHTKSAVGDKQRDPPRTAPNVMAAAFSKIKT
ncbi:MAG: S1 RNA binding domain-containing protein [Candidatus Nitrotoga sp. LAW]|nr:MAG: S1 RNA binding domain-containing protein [Candidatus Nitrotoga sp. LAW]